MTSYDVTHDDEPIDVQAVSDDDRLVEQLRHALSPEDAVVWDDNDDEKDPGYALLRALQRDVSAGLPVGESTLPAEVVELLPRRRHLSRTATIAVVAAGVLSIGGVAAASAPGQPLAGAREAVANAVSSAVHAVTPDAPVGPAVVETVTSPTPKPSPPGDAVSDAARSASAVLQIEANLDRAEAMIDKGQLQAAGAQLDAAERKLAYVTDSAVRAGLQARLDDLRSKLAVAPTAKPTRTPATDDKGKSAGNGKTEQNADHSRQSGTTTHKPTAAPSRAASQSSVARLRNAATRAAVERPDSHRGNDN
jgi:hypothetical protein